MRLFYASFLAADTARAYEEQVDRLIAGFPRILRAVPKGSLHLTLAFLGELQEADLPACQAVLEQIAGTRGFPIALTPPRILRGRGAPRLICLELTRGRERVARLQKGLRLALRSRLPGVPVDPKPPHVTLARFNRGSRKVAGTAVEQAMALAGHGPLRDRVESIRLVRSTLTRQGPIYESVGRVDLAN